MERRASQINKADRPGQPRGPARSLNRIEVKIDTKPMREVAPGHPNSTLNRSRHPLGTHCVAQQRSRSVSRASGGVPGARRKSSERLQERSGTPERAPKSARMHAEVTKIDAKSCPGATESRSFPLGSFAHHRRNDFVSNFVDVRARRTASEPSKVLRLPAKTKVRCLALQVELLARCYLENQRKSIPKSIQIGRKSHPGAARAPFSVGFGRSKRRGRATRSDPGRGKLDRGWLDRAGTPARRAKHARAC